MTLWHLLLLLSLADPGWAQFQGSSCPVVARLHGEQGSAGDSGSGGESGSVPPPWTCSQAGREHYGVMGTEKEPTRCCCPLFGLYLSPPSLNMSNGYIESTGPRTIRTRGSWEKVSRNCNEYITQFLSCRKFLVFWYCFLSWSRTIMCGLHVIPTVHYVKWSEGTLPCLYGPIYLLWTLGQGNLVKTGHEALELATPLRPHSILV